MSIKTLATNYSATSSLGFLLIRALLRQFLSALFRIEVQGFENIPKGGYVLVANHLNWIDGFLLMALLPATPPLYIIADMHAIHKRWWRRLIVEAIGRIITIDRSHNQGDRAAMRAAYRTLDEGSILALFPEGRIGDAEGQVGRLKRGIGAVCLHSGKQVLPVGLSGSSELYLGREIIVTIGEALTPTTSETTAPRRIDDLTDQVQRALERTLPLYQERPVAHKRMRWLTKLLS